MTTVDTLFNSLALWRERAHGRRLLLELDERLLKDIGMTESAAAAEAAKPWWRA